jgi:hypothetical protein
LWSFFLSCPNTEVICSETSDTLGPEKQFIIQRFPLFKGRLTCIAIYLDPQK